MIALVVGADVPHALVRAAGLQPVVCRADEVEEGLASPDVACVVFSALHAHHAQVYHRLHARARGDQAGPELVLVDLPVVDTEASRRFGATKLRELADRLSEVSGVEVTAQRLRRELREPPPAVAPVTPRGGRRAVVVGADLVPDAVARVEAAGLVVVAVEGPGGYAERPRQGRSPAATDDPWDHLLDEHLRRVRTTSRASMRARARALLALASSAGADTVVLAGDPRDDTAAWLRPHLARVVTADLEPVYVVGLDELDAQAREVGSREAGQARPRRPAPAAAGREEETRSRKSLESIATFGAYQRSWFHDLRDRVDRGEPFAVVNADAPQEILRALDIPFVVNQWWASIVAAKQGTPAYRRALADHGYPPAHEAYNSQGLADVFVPSAEAPWGGLPRPDVLQAVRSDDAVVGIFEEWASVTGADLVLFDRTAETRARFEVDWWERLPHDWDRVLAPERLDLMTAQLWASAEVLERRTGRRLDEERLVAVLHLVNEQEEYFRRTRDLIAATTPAPASIVDTMPATMIPQWHRGTTWGRDAARRVHDEVLERVRRADAVCASERVRLMWVGRGAWQQMRLYQAFEATHGAVFVWSMYLGLAADGYLRYFGPDDDPMRSLAARFLTMGDELRMPTWSAAWHVAEARRHQVDAVVAVDDAETHVLDELERTGLPVLRLAADNLSLAATDAERLIGEFLTEHFGRA